MSDSDGLEDSTKYQSSRRLPQTQHPDPVKCPRCQSTNTKFCYYNNYNKTQPRHFCKACKRYWTKGGTLRNVPVGGGRKNKRLRCPNTTSATITMDTNNHPDIDDQDSLLPGLTSDPKDTSDVAKGSFKPIDVESYTDSEELKGLVSWDFFGSFIGCTMQQLARDQDDHPRLGLSSSLETNPSSNIPTSFIEMLENDHDQDSAITTTTSMIMPCFQQWQIPITSNFLELNNRNWNDLDTMVLEDLNKPWEDPTFKT